MYLDDPHPPWTKRRPEGPTRIAPEVRAGHALARIEKAFSEATDKLTLDPPRLRDALSVPLTGPDREQQRRFALGWLSWLEGDFTAARSLLEGGTGARSAYWLARCRLLLGDVEGLSAFEQQMRTFQGSPQATCWFVDLLWRAGRHERAAQVWKSVRLNKRVLACEEAALLEARAFIAQDDLALAEKALLEASPSNGVLRAERQLLLSWLAHARRNESVALKASILLPSSARQTWNRLLQRDLTLTFDDLKRVAFSPPARAWIEAQHARLTGGDSLALLASVTTPRLTTHVRYVRAILGQEDFSALLGSLPGSFLASRCRLWVTLHRFCRREAMTGETLGVLEQVSKAEHGVVDLEPWIDLVRRLNDPATTPDSLWESDTNNHRRAAVEWCLSHGSTEEATAKLAVWSADARLDDHLRVFIERELVRRRGGESLENLLASSESVALQSLWEVAQGRSASDTLQPFVADEKAGPLALCLLAFDALARGDLVTLSKWLAPCTQWQRLDSGPPTFLCRALTRIAGSERYREMLSGWLAQWPQPNPAMQTLSERVGLTLPKVETASPPSGVEPAAWFLHQTSQALSRHDPSTALAWLQRAHQQGLNEEQRHIVELALPDLERLTRAAQLARTVRPNDTHPITDSRLLTDLCKLLHEAHGEDVTHATLNTLAEASDLQPRLAHHLALINLRAADLFEQQELDNVAAPYWKRAWRAWLTWAAASDLADATLIIDHLLERHRLRLSDLLARNAVARARPLWDLLQTLSPPTTPNDSPLVILLLQRLERFRDELATSYLLDTREAMRHGAIPEGWRVDYEQGLSRLRRLMSLDRDNRRLLTALVEICADWFLDLYDLRDEGRIRQEVERYTPFALQLARMVAKPDQTWSEELSARASLAEFFKFRAFVSEDPEHKRALYREALAFNPSNDNVRNLLGGLEDQS